MPDFPTTIAPDFFEMRLMGNTRVSESPFTKSIQVLEMAGAKWVGRMRFNDRVRDQMVELETFLASLKGRATVFDLVPFHRLAPANGGGTPLVNGASQTGGSLITDGWTVSQSPIMSAGEFFAVNGELKQVTADANSDGSGNATLSFVPPLRASPADNAALTVSSPKSGFRLQSDQGYNIAHVGNKTGIDLSFTEAF